VAGHLYPRLRLVEDELPDAIADEPPVVPSTPLQPIVPLYVAKTVKI
jgi:hypothetical protein